MQFRQIGFIGAGQMAQALITGFQNASLIDSTDVHFYDPLDSSAQSFEQVSPQAHRETNTIDVCKKSEIIVLAVKPQRFVEACSSLHGHLDSKVVVSVIAGITIDGISDVLGTTQVIRVMPNTPCLIGEGAAGIAANATVDQAATEFVTKLISSVAQCVSVTESQLDIVTGLSGSGPAYVFSFLEAMVDGGVRLGLPRDVSLELALATVSGAVELAKSSDSSLTDLRNKVTSPGGTTAAGLFELDQGRLSAVIQRAIEAAAHRATELGKTPS